jgi:glutathione S-transferase
MKTILDLKLLDIGYDRQRLTFSEIRTKLSARVVDNVTVPTLELSNGSHLIDSWVISQYLYQNHPKGSLLFPTTSSRSFARFVEQFTNFALAPNVRPITRVELWSALDEDSKVYFEHHKIGKKKMNQFRALTRDEKEEYVQLAAQALQPIEAALFVAKEKSPGIQVWLEGGSHPTHADFVLFGWQCYTCIAGPSYTKQIWNAHPAVAKWVRDIKDWAGPEITGDFF